MRRTVELHDMGRWNDDVGVGFQRVAERAVSQFNRSTASAFAAIGAVDSYNEKDISYESQRERILRMKVEFRG